LRAGNDADTISRYSDSNFDTRDANSHSSHSDS
jgi:hypothetical protein